MNRILIDCKNINPPIWIKDIEPFMQNILNKIIKKATLDVISQENKNDPALYNDDIIRKSINGLNLELSILFCDDDFIKDLNKEYRGNDCPTDVLSFENGDTYNDGDLQFLILGDIVISVSQIASNAAEFSTDEFTERNRLLVHGLLHLLGFDHGDEHLGSNSEPQCEMLKLQEELLG